VAARRAVLALPRHGLARLAPGTPLAEVESFRTDLDAVTTVPLFHLLLAYERPWWEQLGIADGRSATDLPIQSCFYFGADPDTGRALAMVGYSSAEAIELWDSYLRPGPPDAEPAPAEPPAEMLVEVTRQLGLLHGIDVPAPYWAQLMDWRGGEFGGASHRWAVGARSWEVIPRMRRPVDGLPVHVCGEAWSGLQGWNEGALRSAERVLRDELELPAPEWMSADAYLGP
ncbi:MAG: FAD-dependent oxidoreductase, partial [Actinobacteria bacterium]|nr:FAD-dependent oxidoreductase [Actinomycetota bacterium]